jgi:hypothetical protein
MATTATQARNTSPSEDEADKGKLAYELIIAKVKDPLNPAYPIKTAAREVAAERDDGWTAGAIAQAWYNYTNRPAVRQQLGLPPKDDASRGRPGRAKSAVRPTAIRIIETDELTETVDRLLGERIHLTEQFLEQMRLSDEAVREALSRMVKGARAREEAFSERERALDDRMMKARKLDEAIKEISAGL